MRSHSRSVCRILNRRNPLRGAEIGVWRGETSSALLSTFPNLFLLMVDPWDMLPEIETMPKSVEALVQAYKTAMSLTEFAAGRRQVVKGIGKDAADEVGDDSLDFVFIDGNHKYEYVKEDIETWFPKVRPGGLVMGHDYDGRGDRALGWGVKRAVDEFAIPRGYEINQARSLVWWFKK